MFQAKYRICDLFGIPVYVNLSFVVLLLLFVTDALSGIARAT